MATWTPGFQIGPYTLVERIGAGGMGEVWKAQDARLHRTVAIKRLKERYSARFEQEARAIAALNHPHICTLYDIGPDYLVMEYVEGLPMRGALPAAEATRLALQIAMALEAAHAKGIIHRDLKPANVLVTAAGAKLLDFGLAKVTGAADATQTIEGTVAGTAAYMSPEQARGEALDARSDVFSFGAVLYELLSGRTAFTGASATDILSAVLRDEPLTLDAPQEIVRVVERCLRKRREERFGSMTEVRAALEPAASAGPREAGPSIAVLPFANMSGEKEQEYFSDGLAEEIINSLVKVPGLKVIARTSAFAFKGQNTDIRKIAETLGVRHVLEGSVRRSGTRLRVTAQLITASDGTHLWSERYDRQMEDIFDMQDEIAAAIAGALHTKLGGAPAQVRRRKPDLRAYEYFLKAKFHMGLGGPDSFAQAGGELQQAIELDVNFALAHAWMGLHAYLTSSYFPNAGGLVSMARAHARRAIEIDPGLPEAHMVLGVVAIQHDYDWAGGRRHFETALASPAASADVRRFYASGYLLGVGRVDDAVATARQAVLEDPLFPPPVFQYAVCLLAAGRVEDAIHELESRMETAGKHAATHTILACAYARAGRIPEAVASAERGYAVGSWLGPSAGVLAGLLDRVGEAGRAREILDKFGSEDQVPLAHALFHGWRGDMDCAVASYRKVIEQRDALAIPTVHMMPEFRRHPGWPELARMMNLPDTG